MSRRPYRPQKNRTKAQAGSTGAPLKGVFIVGSPSFNPGTGQGKFLAQGISPSGTIIDVEQWTREKEIDVDAFEMLAGGIKVPILSAKVDAFGTAIEITYTPTMETLVFMVKPGHPALNGANGTVCGGLLAGV